MGGWLLLLNIANEGRDTINRVFTTSKFVPVLEKCRNSIEASECHHSTPSNPRKNKVGKKTRVVGKRIS